VEIAENAMPGSVELELNRLTLDTVVLRDGTVLLGNLISVTGTGVNINVKGKPMKLERSRVARIVLGERKASVATPATKTGKSPSSSKK
jgi:hypothetical protein